jgi:hypothetical protein
MSKHYSSEMSLQFGFVMIALTIITTVSLFGAYGDSTIPKQDNTIPQLIHRQWVV